VGDEKQSIFVSGNRSQFEINRPAAGVCGSEHPQRVLITSRRSAPEILAFVDKVFSRAARAG
jgi:ATP-dependent exoDNAse (exonuclease V) beta subunit